MKALIRGLLVFVILLGAAGATAQEVELTQTVVMFPQIYTVSMPDDWTMQHRKAIGKTELTDGDVMIGLFTEEGVLARILPIDETTSTGDVLVDLYEDFFGDDSITRDDVRPFDYGGKSGHIYMDVEGQIAGVMRLEDATFVLIRVDELNGEAFTEGQLEAIMAILGSVTAGNDVTQLRDPAMASMGEPCFVSAPEGRDVRLRVGPGFNRGVITFLGPDEYKVYGQLRTDDNVVWYKLDPWAVAPEKDANELWVEARDVLRVGDCDLVADAAPPPLLAFSDIQPARIPGVQIPEDAGVPPTEDSVVPVEGTYTLYHGQLGSASCLDGGSESIRFEGESLQPVTGALFVRNSGAAFAFADIVFIREASGDYVGTMRFLNGAVEYIRLKPVNSGRFEGFRTQDISRDGRQCSMSVAVTLAR